MPTPTPRIFVSHSNVDNAFGLQLIADLRARLGDDAVWYDQSGGLHGGDDWWREIVAQITARDTFIVVLSPNAVASRWVPKEMGIAYYQNVVLGKHILPILLAPCELTADWQMIQSISFVDYPANYAANLEKVAEALHLGGVIAHQPAQSLTPPPVQHRLTPIEQIVKDINTAFALYDWGAVIDRTDTLQEIAPNEMTATLWGMRGLALLNTGRGSQALQALERALATTPHDVPLLRAKAQAQRLTGQGDPAATLRLAYTLVPYEDHQLRLGVLVELYDALLAAKRWDDALQRAEEALRLAPNDANWQQRRSQVQVKQHEEVARQEHERIARILPPRLQTLGFAVSRSGTVDFILPPLCSVPAGPFTMGGDSGSYNGTATVKLTLGAFQIGMFPVTVAEWACGVAAGAVPAPQGSRPYTWSEQQQRPEHPVVCVSWLNARDYAAWLAQMTGQAWQLPTEAEWEKAARGTDGRIYPWGNTWDASRTNTDNKVRTTTPVGAYAEKGDASPCGAHDMAGNVWEWTSSIWHDGQPYDPIQCENNRDEANIRALRGGSWDDDSQLSRAASRGRFYPINRSYVGARLLLGRAG